MIEHMLKSYDEGSYLKRCPCLIFSLSCNNGFVGDSIALIANVNRARAAVLYLSENCLLREKSSVFYVQRTAKKSILSVATLERLRRHLKWLEFP